uniref:Uncharacterized protein n=1 Tax=Ciona intestinalis TaxID=7719 RepID=H2XLA6_CIOIN
MGVMALKKSLKTRVTLKQRLEAFIRLDRLSLSGTVIVVFFVAVSIFCQERIIFCIFKLSVLFCDH